jgi:murein DD-endopeptidase MepM/ murein hydrolase activator NlpD
MISPVGNPIIMIDRFGERIRNFKKESHLGVDLRAAMDEPIYAPEIMKIIRHGTGDTFGEHFIVAVGQDSGFIYKFMHVGLVELIKDNFWIAEGTVFAKSDMSGTTAAHLHFEIWPAGSDGHGKIVYDPEAVFFNQKLGIEFEPYIENGNKRWKVK